MSVHYSDNVIPTPQNNNVLIVGLNCVDLVACVGDRYPEADSKVTTVGFSQSGGGNGANVSVGVSRLLRTMMPPSVLLKKEEEKNDDADDNGDDGIKEGRESAAAAEKPGSSSGQVFFLSPFSDDAHGHFNANDLSKECVNLDYCPWFSSSSSARPSSSSPPPTSPTSPPQSPTETSGERPVCGSKTNTIYYPGARTGSSYIITTLSSATSGPATRTCIHTQQEPRLLPLPLSGVGGGDGGGGGQFFDDEEEEEEEANVNDQKKNSSNGKMTLHHVHFIESFLLPKHISVVFLDARYPESALFVAECCHFINNNQYHRYNNDQSKNNTTATTQKNKIFVFLDCEKIRLEEPKVIESLQGLGGNGKGDIVDMHGFNDIYSFGYYNNPAVPNPNHDDSDNNGQRLQNNNKWLRPPKRISSSVSFNYTRATLPLVTGALCSEAFLAQLYPAPDDHGDGKNETVRTSNAAAAARKLLGEFSGSIECENGGAAATTSQQSQQQSTTLSFVVATLGEAGSLMVSKTTPTFSTTNMNNSLSGSSSSRSRSGDEVIHIPAILPSTVNEVVDTIGAGDAYAAGLVCAVWSLLPLLGSFDETSADDSFRTHVLTEALTFAAAVAGHSVCAAGARDGLPVFAHTRHNSNNDKYKHFAAAGDETTATDKKKKELIQEHFRTLRRHLSSQCVNAVIDASSTSNSNKSKNDTDGVVPPTVTPIAADDHTQTSTLTAAEFVMTHIIEGEKDRRMLSNTAADTNPLTTTAASWIEGSETSISQRLAVVQVHQRNEVGDGEAKWLPDGSTTICAEAKPTGRGVSEFFAGSVPEHEQVGLDPEVPGPLSVGATPQQHTTTTTMGGTIGDDVDVDDAFTGPSPLSNNNTNNKPPTISLDDLFGGGGGGQQEIQKTQPVGDDGDGTTAPGPAPGPTENEPPGHSQEVEWMDDEPSPVVREAKAEAQSWLDEIGRSSNGNKSNSVASTTHSEEVKVSSPSNFFASPPNGRGGEDGEGGEGIISSPRQQLHNGSSSSPSDLDRGVSEARSAAEIEAQSWLNDLRVGSDNRTDDADHQVVDYDEGDAVRTSDIDTVDADAAVVHHDDATIHAAHHDDGDEPLIDNHQVRTTSSPEPENVELIDHHTIHHVHDAAISADAPPVPRAQSPTPPILMDEPKTLPTEHEEVPISMPTSAEEEEASRIAAVEQQIQSLLLAAEQEEYTLRSTFLLSEQESFEGTIQSQWSSEGLILSLCASERAQRDTVVCDEQVSSESSLNEFLEGVRQVNINTLSAYETAHRTNIAESEAAAFFTQGGIVYAATTERQLLLTSESMLEGHIRMLQDHAEEAELFEMEIMRERRADLQCIDARRLLDDAETSTRIEIAEAESTAVALIQSELSTRLNESYRLESLRANAAARIYDVIMALENEGEPLARGAVLDEENMSYANIISEFQHTSTVRIQAEVDLRAMLHALSVQTQQEIARIDTESSKALLEHEASKRRSAERLNRLREPLDKEIRDFANKLAADVEAHKSITDAEMLRVERVRLQQLVSEEAHCRREEQERQLEADALLQQRAESLQRRSYELHLRQEKAKEDIHRRIQERIENDLRWSATKTNKSNGDVSHDDSTVQNTHK